VHIGSGIKRIRNLCREYGVAEPRIEVSEYWFTVSFPRPNVESESELVSSIPQVTPHVRKLAERLHGEMNPEEIMDALELKDRMHFANSYLKPALDAGMAEMTIPDKQRSSKQRYRLTELGRELLKQKGKEQS